MAVQMKRFLLTKEWRSMRQRVLREQPTCQCGARATVVHHIIDREDAPGLALKRSNLMSMCAPCHNRRTGWSGRNKMRKRPLPVGHDAQGTPLDPSHPWNR